MKKPLIIGIAGGAGSGKTTLSRYLEERAQPCRVRVIAMDRYYKKERPQAAVPFHGNPFEDFNQPDALDFIGSWRTCRTKSPMDKHSF
ncbi:hypothetical protein AV654_31705 [Paenibacillus elgii]|uniref:Phosphoribulokinase/uridine kinase domain-containing protein n=1 Tax=Paenibacillus elgii TaxID=189691 RepID=A0A163UNP8_9BACL|nr:hypothetical protein [Paenibacillus elgii]KZE73600.1 hypothetical protein AV654_31705 [Paenibacillus elgii]